MADANACPRSGGICGPGFALMTRLAAAMELATTAGPALELAGHCDALCPHGACRLHWRGGRTMVEVTASSGMELRLSLATATIN